MHDKDVVSVVGIARKIVRKTTKKGDDMAFVVIEDYYGEMEVILFPKVYEAAAMHLGIDRAVYVTGSISSREDEGVKLLASAVQPLVPNGSYQEKPISETFAEKQKVEAVKTIQAANQPVRDQQDTIMAKQIFIRLPSFECDVYRRSLAILNIFTEEANADVVLYHAGEGKYHKLSNQKLRTSVTVVSTLRKICGDENIILRY